MIMTLEFFFKNLKLCAWYFFETPYNILCEKKSKNVRVYILGWSILKFYYFLAPENSVRNEEKKPRQTSTT